MTFLIRILLSITFLSSCTLPQVDYPYIDLWKDALFRKDISVDEIFIEESKFSFIKVSYKKNDAIFILSSVNNDGVYTWVGSNYEIIKTYNGLILETSGLFPDTSIHAGDQLKIISTKFQEPLYSFYLDIDEPELLSLPVTYTLKNKKVFQGELAMSFERTSPIIGWVAQDKYWYRDGLIVRSEISITPLEPSLRIQFYYKY